MLKSGVPCRTAVLIVAVLWWLVVPPPQSLLLLLVCPARSGSLRLSHQRNGIKSDVLERLR